MDRQSRLLHKGEATRHASFLELFFDLVFVFALTRVVARAVDDLSTRSGANDPRTIVADGLKTTFLLLALWAVWQGTAWTTSQYDPYQPVIQVIVLIALASSMVMAVAIRRQLEPAALAFAAGYVTAQMSRPLLLAFALRGTDRQRLKVRMLMTCAATGVVWLAAAALARGWVLGLLWATALAIEYLAGRSGWPVPGLGRSTASEWGIAGEHLADRYQQFFLVALGESVLAMGLAYKAHPETPMRMLAFGMALATSVLIWRIYFYRAGRILAEAVAQSRQPARIGRSAAESHMLMVAGVITSAVGYELALLRPTGHIPPVWIIVILGGPALYIVGRSRFEHEVFNRVSPSRLVAFVLLVALIPTLLWAPSLIVLGAAGIVLCGVAVADVRRAWGRPLESPSPPV
ncbi:low temperature requirement protein A [Micromonospora sp. WMMC241]|uniref:low temperature requirement protein A n=1 Tax=Micromonospora sp. WMMC241 TaxID=3015159 RepID=UPI0022B673C6|nr:low temperature requirement protein A [Micromonospora sp. WMMC241]MCZ7437319.1 low temperature requirement protein A [Micromonospora sp. WMMC241]